MIYNFYDIAKIYGVNRSYIHRKYRELKKELKGTIRELKKDGRTALQGNDLKRLIDFLGYDIDKLKRNWEGTQREPAGNREDTSFFKEQVKDLQNIIKQQNSIIAMTQKNLNDLIQDNKKIKIENVKKTELISKWNEEQENLKELHKQIDKAIGAKRAIEVKESIEFGYKLLKEKKKQKQY